MNKAVKKTARQIAQEPWEVLKNVPRQVVGEGHPFSEKPAEETPQENHGPSGEAPNLQGDKVKSQRLVEAYERELKDIRMQRLMSQLQRAIARGDTVYLQEYPQLSLEQKQVLKAQMEAVRNQDSASRASNSSLIEPTAKKGRRFRSFGRKSQVERQQTKVESPLPPSG